MHSRAGASAQVAAGSVACSRRSKGVRPAASDGVSWGAAGSRWALLPAVATNKPDTYGTRALGELTVADGISREALGSLPRRPQGTVLSQRVVLLPMSATALNGFGHRRRGCCGFNVGADGRGWKLSRNQVAFPAGSSSMPQSSA